MSPPTDAAFVRFGKLIRITHQWIQIHMHVDEVWGVGSAEGCQRRGGLPSKWELLGSTGGILVNSTSKVGVRAGL